MRKAKRQSVWDRPSPYGTYEGDPGSPWQWQAAFSDAWSAPVAKEILKDESPWEVLGIRPSSSESEIKAAFRRLITEHHPDHGGDNERARRIIAAYATLGGKRTTS
jgi:hypothetical protein